MEYAYQSRIEEFKKIFSFLQNKKIVLYGLGRRTADIIAAHLDFNIVGLMDKNDEGREFCGLPVLSIDEAERIADAVIINTTESYWETIYKRIEKITLPVYFCNGLKAEHKEIDCKNLFMMRNQENRVILNKIFEKLGDNYDRCTGKIKINTFEMLGYCIIGPVMLAFCHFIKNKCKEYGIKKLFFFARDGYFLRENFDYFMSLEQQKYNISTTYFYASRILAYVVGLENNSDFEEWMSFLFHGTFEKYMEDRMGVECYNDLHASEIINIPKDLSKVRKWMLPYLKQIEYNLAINKSNYKNYVMRQQPDSESAYVDIGFGGTIQWKLNKMIGNDIKGFYFTINNDTANKYRSAGNMFPCFQNPDDLLAENSWTKKYYVLLESFFTAPHGMIRAVTSAGEPIYTGGGYNQKYFLERKIINKGVKEFINDMRGSTCEDAMTIDMYYGNLYASMLLSDDIMKIFYMDEGMTGGKEIRIFER